ncbi:hypothetical protein AB4278_07450 [Vibrio splendidus]
MVNQTIEQLLQEAIDQSMAQTQESRELADDVSGLIGDIRNEVAQAVQRTDEAIDDVNAAIPAAINTKMNQTLHVDPVNGDDTNDGLSISTSVRTIDAAVALIPEFGGARLEILGDIGYGSQLLIKNKHITMDLNGHTFTQLTSPSIGTFLLDGDSRFIFSAYSGTGGKVVTALLDANCPNATDDTALFKRNYLSSIRVAFMYVDLELGDQAIGANALGASGIAEFLFSHAEITINEATITPLIFRTNKRHLLFTINITTLPGGINVKDLVSGVTYYADGTPINILSSNDFTETI